MNIGVLGCADIAWRMVIPAMKRVEGVRLVAVASRDEAKARRFAERFDCDPVVGYDELLGRSDVDAVYIPLPSALHVPWALDALKAGKHVLVEKPLATTLSGAREVVDLAATTGLTVVEGFMFLHHSQHQAVAQLVADGQIGAVREFEAVFGIPGLPKDNFRNQPELGGGALLDIGVYPVRSAQLFLGDSLSVAGAALTFDGGVDVDGAALLRTEDGRIARLGFGMRHGYRCTYTLWGALGRITVERAFTTPATLDPVVHLELPSGRRRVELPADDHFHNIVRYFADAVRSGEGADLRHAEILRQASLIDQIRDAGTVIRGLPA